MNILIVKLSAIGDVVHTLPSLSALRKLYPQARITWVIEEAASDLIRNHPYLDQMIISRRKPWLEDIKKGRFGVLKEIRQFIKELRSCHYDLVIDFHGLFKSSLIVLLARAPRKLGFDSMQELSGLFVNEKIPEDMGKHAVARYLDFIRYLDPESLVLRDSFEAGVIESFIPVGDEEEKKIMDLVKLHGLEGREFVAVNPVAFWETKLWQERKFAQLCDLIVDSFRVSIVFTGTGKEDLGPIQAMMRNPAVNMAGETSLRELACLYRKAAALITTDSGPMHIAAAMGTPVVALFGPTDPARTGPCGKNHRVIRKDLSCSPCFLKRCPTKECMRRIEVEEVFQAVESSLRRTN